jgi:hypothetical protein
MIPLPVDSRVMSVEESLGYRCLYLFVLSILVTLGDGNTKQKRLLLNDPDVANRLASMENMINILTQQMKEMKSGGGKSTITFLNFTMNT